MSIIRFTISKHAPQCVQPKPSNAFAILKYTRSESASTIVVMKGLAITAGSKPSFLAQSGSVQPITFATSTVTHIVKLMLIDRFLLGNEDVTLPVCAVVCFTMCVTVLVAKVIGCTLPLCAKKLGFDPAVMASPFITTIVDALSLLVYFSIATAILF